MDKVDTQLSAIADELITDLALEDSDDDEFAYGDISAELAVLITTSARPLNIALFGRWGSGKSSLLRLLRNELGSKKVRTVEYDAWKFGGAALRRNFISEAARQLGFDKSKRANRDFYDGLYATQKTVHFETERLWSGIAVPWAKLFIGLAIVFGVLLGASVLLAQYAPNTFSSLPDFFIGLVAAGLSAVTVAGLSARALIWMLAPAQITVDEPPPATDQNERFAEVFQELIQRTTKNDDPIVFLVDELDRCSPSEVLQTLDAIKTFLWNPHCVFVVAIDRQVLESAIEQSSDFGAAAYLHQGLRGADDYIDKVFQRQIYLPPPRPIRLQSFARNLVSAKDGVWAWLNAEEYDSRPLLVHVLFILIPDYVRSPRKVKLLLNEFVLNYRFSKSRGLDAKERVLELAKWTVLRVEFPSLAEHMRDFPDLPALLVDPERLSDRSAATRLAARYYLSFDDEELVPHPQDSALEAAPGASTPQDRQPSISQTDLAKPTAVRLLRYLRRVRRYPAPGRDVIFVEPFSVSINLPNVELGRRIETDVIDNPIGLADKVCSADEKNHAPAISALASMSEQHDELERQNVIRCLLTVACNTASPGTAAMDEAASAVVSYVDAGEPVAEELALDALIVILSSSIEEKARVLYRIPYEHLLEVPEDLSKIAVHFANLPTSWKGKVGDSLKRMGTKKLSILLDTISEMEPDDGYTLLEYLDLEPADLEISNQEEATEAISFGAALLQGLCRLGSDHSEQADLIMQVALSGKSETCYPAIKDAALQLLEGMSPTEAGSRAIQALRFAPSDDWEFWGRFLREGLNLKHLKISGKDAIKNIVPKVGTLEADEQRHAVQLTDKIAKLTLGEIDADQSAEIAPAIQNALAERNPLSGDSERICQLTLYELAQVLRKTTAPLRKAIDPLILQDIKRLLPDQPPQFNHRTRDFLVSAAPLLPKPTLVHLANWLKSGAIAQNAAAARRAMVARLATIRALRVIEPESMEVPTDEALSLVDGPTQESIAIAVEWLRTGPNGEELLKLLELLPNVAERNFTKCLGAQLEQLDRRERTNVLIAVMASNHPASGWLDAFGSFDIDPTPVLEAARNELRSRPRHEQREELCQKLSKTIAIRRADQSDVETLVRDLLKTQTQSNTELVFDYLVDHLDLRRSNGVFTRSLVDALQAHPRSKKRWRQLLERKGVLVEKKKGILGWLSDRE